MKHVPPTQTYISVLNAEDSIKLKQITEDLGVYTDPDTTEVHLRFGSDEVDLGFRDITISRLHEQEPPVQLQKTNTGVEIRNVDNESEVYIEYLHRTTKLSRTESTHVTTDCLVEPGLYTQLRLSINKQYSPKNRNTFDSEIPVSEVNHLCEFFAMTAEKAPDETTGYGKRLLNTIQDYPIGTGTYDDIKFELESIINKLDESDSAEKLAERLSDNINQLSRRIEDLYNRQQ